MALVFLIRFYGFIFTFTFYYFLYFLYFLLFRLLIVSHCVFVQFTQIMHHLSLELLVALLPRHHAALERASFGQHVPFSVLAHVVARDSARSILRQLGRSLGVRTHARSDLHAWHFIDFCRLWTRAGFPGGPQVLQYLNHISAIILAWLLCGDPTLAATKAGAGLENCSW